MNGKIIKGIAGFYYVHVPNEGLYECKAKGSFRNKKIKPLVGDNVIIDVVDKDKFLGNIVDILPRKNELIRPATANIDQAILIFAINEPAPNINLLSRFLITMELRHIETIICFNKTDIATDEEKKNLYDILSGCGCRIIFASTYDESGIEEIRAIIKGKTTAFAGPSGVGKSSMLNLIDGNHNMDTGEISQKIKRGKHTTRHSEIFNIDEDTYIIDTPGFTSLYVKEIDKDDLKYYFAEFEQYENQCRFNGCIHINEPDCAVKNALNEGRISKVRYNNYIEMYKELKEQRRY